MSPGLKRGWKLATLPALLFAGWIDIAACHAETAQGSAPSEELLILAGQTRTLLERIEAIRSALNAPKIEQSPIDLSFATEREIFHQAQVLFKNANQLCFEHTSYLELELPSPEGVLSLSHSINVLTRTGERIDCGLEALDIEPPIAVAPNEDPVLARDVFLAITQANDQIGAMLDNEIQPILVFRQVTVALSYATLLREAFPGAAMPEEPDFLAEMKPKDVFVQLLRCFGLVATMSQALGLPIPDILSAPAGTIAPRHVHDLATLIVAELELLHDRLGHKTRPFPVPFPDVKEPSHVHQRARLLEFQLRSLSEAVREHAVELDRDREAS